MAYDKRRIEKSQYVLGVKPSTLDAPIAAQAGDFDPAPKYEYSSDGKTVTWTNRDRMPKVAAQAGDEPMRLVSANLLDRAVALLQSSGQMGVAHQLREGASPRATTAIAEALQVCVKTLEFRKERSANDEFALNLARIALAESPRATADVEREGGALHDALIRCCKELPEGYLVRVEVERSAGWVEWFGPENLTNGNVIDGEGHLSDDVVEALAAIATTKPGA